MKLTPAQLEIVFPYFAAFWVTAGLAAAGFFMLNRNARLKRKVFVGLVVGADIIFAGFVWATAAPLPFLAIVTGCLAFGAWQAIRFTRFCGACGANNFPQGRFQARTECRKCNAPMTAGERG